MAGMFAGIFMMLNAESVAQTEADQFGMEQGAKEEQGVQEDMSGERSPEETAALVSAMIQPSANKKVGGGNASADPAGRLAAIAEDLKAGKTTADSKFLALLAGQKLPLLPCQPNKAKLDLNYRLPLPMMQNWLTQKYYRSRI